MIVRIVRMNRIARIVMKVMIGVIVTICNIGTCSGSTYYHMCNNMFINILHYYDVVHIDPSMEIIMVAMVHNHPCSTACHDPPIGKTPW